jgi:hypothetical protein
VEDTSKKTSAGRDNLNLEKFAGFGLTGTRLDINWGVHEAEIEWDLRVSERMRGEEVDE